MKGNVGHTGLIQGVDGVESLSAEESLASGFRMCGLPFAMPRLQVHFASSFYPVTTAAD